MHTRHRAAPTTDISSSKKSTFSWLDLLKAVYFMLGGERLRYFALTIALLGLHFNAVITPLLLGRIVDFFTNYTPQTSMTEFYTLVGIITVLQMLVSYFRLGTKQAMAIVQTQISYNIRVDGFQKLMDLSLAWHDSEGTGNKFQRIQNGTQELRLLMRMTNNEIYGALTKVIGIIGVFIFLQPLYILLVVTYVSIFSYLLKHFYKLTTQIQEEQNAAMERASGAYIEGLGNILSIKATGAQGKFTRSISNAEAVRKQYEIMLTRLSIQKWRTFHIVNGLMAGSYLLLVGHDVTTGAITVGSILIVYQYANQLVGSAGEILDVYDRLIACKTSIGRMMSILWSKDVPTGGSKKFPQQWNAMSIENATFVYPQSKIGDAYVPGLNNITLRVKKNEKIGVVGKTGSGKSTIAKVLMGLYPLQSGTIMIGKTPLTDISHKSLTQHMTLVLQESEMFNMSIRENITLLRNIPDETLAKAIEIAQLESVIAKLPEGIETLIGEKGYHLSGGERQRVGIARAICQDPEIIIFDEATSSLDSQTESAIQNALESKLNQKTLIFIAHRVSTLKNVDCIHVFQDGSIVETGSYNELHRKKDSLFNMLYATQKK